MNLIICSSIFQVGEPFAKWVKLRCDERHANAADERNLNVEMDPEVAQVFRNSTAVSTANGSSFQMMKMTAVRRRGKQEILDAKAAEARKQAEIEAKLAKYEQYEA